MATIKEVMELLKTILKDNTLRRENVRKFCEMGWNIPGRFPDLQNQGIKDLIQDLVYELTYYEPNPEWRAEDDSFFDDERLEELIRKFLGRLSRRGIDVGEF